MTATPEQFAVPGIHTAGQWLSLAPDAPQTTLRNPRSDATLVDALRTALTGGDQVALGVFGFEADSPAQFMIGTAQHANTIDRAAVPTRSVQHPALERTAPDYASIVELAVATIAGSPTLQKVVLGRWIHLPLAPVPAASDVVGSLHAANPQATSFAVKAPPIEGGTDEPAMFVGATPELLLRRRGDRIESYPLAGSAPRNTEDDQADREAAQALRTSEKNLEEHAYVVAAIKEKLTPYCSELNIPDQPSLLATDSMWHLGTRIVGKLRGDKPLPTALELALALHPTPAVGGTPTAEALRLIAELEPQRRGVMTGGVGWFDSSGDGEFHVAIRGALLGAHGADVFVGAGVIESSQPRHEVLETAHKACTIMRGLDLPQQLQPRVAPPTELEEHYVRRGYWQDETLDQFLRTRARRYRDNLAAVGHSIVTGREESWTYQQLDAATNQVAHRLHAAGVSAGDRVVVQLPNVMEYLATIFGLWRLGALPVFALPAHGATELAQFVMGARARFIIQAHPGAQTVAKISTRIAAAGMLPPTIVDVARWTEPHPAGALAEKAHDSRDIAFLQLSGGTTGIPKLIPRTHTDYLYSVRGSVDICAVDEATRLLVTLPAAHNFPMSSPGILGALHAGGAVVLARDASPRTSFVLIEKHGVTMASLVPPLAAAWLAQAERGRFNVTSLKTIQVGGARLSETVAQRLHGELGVTVQQVFGMAEGLVCYTRLDDPLELQLSTQGRPISPDDEIRIVGPNDQPVPAGAEGELLTRGPYTIRSYYGVPDPHNRLFTSDGFYRTGDLVRQLPTGHLVVTGRVKDQINRGGEKIAIPEVEELLLRHPNVLDAVLIGLPDQYLGERLCAVIVWRDRAIPPRMTAHRQIREHLQRADIAAFKYPDEVLSLREFPVTGVGKNSRAELRRILAHQALNTGQSEPPAVSVGEPSDVAVPVEPPVPAGTTAQSPPYVIAHTTEPYLHPADQPQKPREHLRLPDEHPLEVRTAQ